METKQELREKLKEIERWEQDQKDLWFWEKIGRLPFILLDKATPKFIHKKIGEVIEEIGNFISNGGKYLVDERQVIQKYFKNNNFITLDDVAAGELELMDNASSRLKESSSRIAMVQGGTTGIGGFFTLAIDIPIMLGLTLKSIQEIAVCYGYNPHEQNERIFILKCLQFTSADIVGKNAILDEIGQFDADQNQDQMVSQLQGWSEVLQTYRDQFGWKKLFQMIPIIGVIFGAYTNKSIMDDTAEVAIMLYRKRRILDRLNYWEDRKI